MSKVHRTSNTKGRREDFRLISGRGKYTGDWNLNGQAYGWFLRSDHAHADIVWIDTKAALAVPGVMAVLTGADVVEAGFKAPPAMLFMKGKGGSAFKLPHRHALAHDRVRFVGEPVALVVADSELAAQDGAEQIAVEYRDLPTIVEAEDALADGAPDLHADVPGNLAMEYEYGAQAPTDATFANAALVARLTLDAQRILRQSDGAKGLPRRFRQGDWNLRHLCADPGHVRHTRQLCAYCWRPA